jgi:alpha-L-fucosidase
MLVDIASKGGNFLLNIGPTAEGVFPPEAIERLRGIGQWMSVNGEAIYATQASPFPSLPWGRCTRKRIAGGTRLYLHVFTWPHDGTLLLPEFSEVPKAAYLLADQTQHPLAVHQSGEGLAITVPSAPPDSIDAVIVLDINQEKQ